MMLLTTSCNNDEISDLMTREAREREIVLLRREIEADPPPGILQILLGSILGLIWFLFVSTVIALIVTVLIIWITDSLVIGLIVGGALDLLLNIGYWVSLYSETKEHNKDRKERNKRLARLEQLLREEREDIERTKHTQESEGIS